MRLTHALIVTLVLMVSPLAATVCEVACGLPSTATVDTSAVAPGLDEHAHHAHHAPPPAPSTDPSAASLSAPDCDLIPTSPARLRTSYTDSTASIGAITTPGELWGPATHLIRLRVAAASSPPAPPPPTPLPLRI